MVLVAACVLCGVCVVLLVVVVVRTWSLICVFVHTYQQLATNYGSRVPVDTAPSPVPVYRALKSLHLSQDRQLDLIAA